jgi:hypothetical protein
MTAIATINTPIGDQSDIRISLQLYLAVDPVFRNHSNPDMRITPQEVMRRARATFGYASIHTHVLHFPHYDAPPSWRYLTARGRRIIFVTHVTAWYAPFEAVYRGETFLTDTSRYHRGITMTGVESCAGGETDVITFYADSSLPEPFDKLEHEIGHALGIRHTGSRAA